MSNVLKSVVVGPAPPNIPDSQKSDFRVFLISRSSSDGTEMSLTQSSRSTRGVSIGSDDDMIHSSAEYRESQRSMIFQGRGSFSNQALTDYVATQSTTAPRSRETPSDEVSIYGGSDGIIFSERSSSAKQHRGRNYDSSSSKSQRPSFTSQVATTVSYHGITIATAACQGNLPLCVLLWGMAAAKKVRLMDPDSAGDTPMHFAALADLPEYLLDADLDPFLVDLKGNNIFINLVKCSRLWALHYVYTTLCTKYSLYRTYELLYADDGNGHNAMYWAADLGDVNIIEYLIRRNLDPRIPDSIGVTPLHISSEKGKYDAVIFLIKCGCDPTLKDLNGNSPFSIVRKSNNGKLLSEMKKQFRLQNKENGNGNGNRGERERERGRIESIFCDVCGVNQYYVERILQRKTCPSSTILVGIEGSTCRGKNSNEEEKYLELEDGVGSKDLMRNSRRDMGDPILSPQGCYRNGISLYKGVEGKGKLKPHALRRLNPSRFSYCFIYCIVIVAYWVLSISIPYYGWIALVFGSMFLFRTALRISQKREIAAIAAAATATGTVQKGETSRRYYEELLLAPEKYMGLHLGIIVTCTLFWLCSLRMAVLRNFHDFMEDGPLSYAAFLSPGDKTRMEGYRFLIFGGLTSSVHDYQLFVAVGAVTVLATLLWVRLVWIYTDPGAVVTRAADFDMITEASFNALGPPSDRLYCNTTLIRKPSRSKYCAQTGFVIARMDHHCVWLNNSVGFGNHKVFITFLSSQLVATSLFAIMMIRALRFEIGLRYSDTGVVTHLLDRQYLFPTALCSTLILTSLALITLLIGQGINISRNITSNERLNRNRYHWMKDSSGQPFNHYDKGFLRNILEFWSIPGFQKDYYVEFHCSAKSEKSDKSEKTEKLEIGKQNNEKSCQLSQGSLKGSPGKCDVTTNPDMKLSLYSEPKCDPGNVPDIEDLKSKPPSPQKKIDAILMSRRPSCTGTGTALGSGTGPALGPVLGTGPALGSGAALGPVLGSGSGTALGPVLGSGSGTALGPSQTGIGGTGLGSIPGVGYHQFGQRLPTPTPIPSPSITMPTSSSSSVTFLEHSSSPSDHSPQMSRRAHSQQAQNFVSSSQSSSLPPSTSILQSTPPNISLLPLPLSLTVPTPYTRTFDVSEVQKSPDIKQQREFDKCSQRPSSNGDKSQRTGIVSFSEKATLSGPIVSKTPCPVLPVLHNQATDQIPCKLSPADYGSRTSFASDRMSDGEGCPVHDDSSQLILASYAPSSPDRIVLHAKRRRYDT